MSTRLCIASGALGLLAGIAPSLAVRPVQGALVETLCAQCGRKPPAFLAGLKCYHCGAAWPKVDVPASPAARAPAAPVASAPSAVVPAAPTPPRVPSLGLRQPPAWFAARLPSSGFIIRPPAGHEKVARELRIPADGLAPSGSARAGTPTSIPLPNGPYSAIAVTAEHRGGSEGTPALIYVEVQLADGSCWGRVMKVTPPSGSASGATLRAFWPPAPFAELRLSGLDITGHFSQGAALILSVQVQP